MERPSKCRITQNGEPFERKFCMNKCLASVKPHEGKHSEEWIIP